MDRFSNLRYILGQQVAKSQSPGLQSFVGNFGLNSSAMIPLKASTQLARTFTISVARTRAFRTSPAARALVPIVVEQTVRVSSKLKERCISYLTQGRGERSYDIFSRLLRERVVMLSGPASSFDDHSETTNSSTRNYRYTTKYLL